MDELTFADACSSPTPHVRSARTHTIVDGSASFPSDHGPSPEPSASGPHEPSPRWFRRIQSTHFGKRED